MKSLLFGLILFIFTDFLEKLLLIDKKKTPALPGF
jgi:hypothetical protein